MSKRERKRERTAKITIQGHLGLTTTSNNKKNDLSMNITQYPIYLAL